MGNKASQNNKDQLQQYHQEENKYEDLHQGKEMTNLSYHKSEQSLTFNPLNIERQNKVYQLYETKIKPNHETELSGTKLVSWLSNYLSEERYRSDDAIREDLNDPQYSHLKEKMENDLQDNIDRKTADAIYTVLRNDIFSSSNNDGYVSPEYETSTTINDSETNNSINHHPIRGSIIEHDRTELDELNNQVQFDGIVNLLKQKTIEQEIQLEDEYGANKESFPEFINVALFGRSDDEYLEMLIDQALIKVCYDKKIGEIWTDPKFIQNLYNDNRFPSAVEQLYDKINHDDESVELDFIGDFVSKEFKRQINENKRRVEEEAINDKKEDEIQQRNMNKSNDFDEKYESSYNVFVEKNDDGIDEYIIRKKHLGEKLQHKKRKKLKDDDPLFQLQITSVEEHENDFCWAVFKKKRFKNNYGIKTKGRWEIITEEADKKRKDDEEERRRKQALSSSPNVFKNIMDDMAGKSGKNLLKGVGKKIAKSTRKLAHLDDTKEEEKLPPTPILPSKSTSNVQSNKNGKKKFQYIELAHLNVIFELLQYHYWHSIKEIKEKKSIESKNSKLVSSPMYHDYCALSEDSETITRQKTLLRKEKDYTIIIGDKTYKLCWWNMKGRRECNALAIQYNDRKYFYLHFRHNYEKIEDNKRISRLIFDWYDNDAARYKKYSPGIDHQVYKELEASFQANVDSNFPRSVFDVDAKNDRMFNVCILDELKKYLQETKGLNVDCMVLRFTFTQKTNRILNIEQVSLKKTSCFPRNVCISIHL